MRNRDSKSEFIALLCFVVVMTLVLTNGFIARVRAQGDAVDIYPKLEPIGDVLDKILQEYYETPDMDKVVEGALQGMMLSLDKHSAFLSADALKEMTEDTEGEFEGIGVVIRMDEDNRILIFQALPESPAAKVGLQAFDRIKKIDDVSTDGMTLTQASKMIKGPRGTAVRITVERGDKGVEGSIQELTFDVTRGKIPLDSVKEARVVQGGVGYVRVSDFRKNTSDELARKLQELLGQGMTSLVLDLRWNPGGLLSASQEMCELFLPENTLVTYIRGRNDVDGKTPDGNNFYTRKPPILPAELPMVVLVNESTASSAEIVTGALQFWSRAIVVGVTTYGKGSVQTIIPLKNPPNSALRLTTALYYTPAEVTIHERGILPDVDVPMSPEQEQALGKQMFDSFQTDPSQVNNQNHGSVTGNEMTDTSVEDVQLQQAVAILKEDSVFDNLLEKYHKDPAETQVAETGEKRDGAQNEPADTLDVETPDDGIVPQE